MFCFKRHEISCAVPGDPSPHHLFFFSMNQLFPNKTGATTSTAAKGWLQRCVLLLALLLTAGSSFANHILGGNLDYAYVSSSGNSSVYRVILTLYGDCSGSSFHYLNSFDPLIVVTNNGSAYLNLTLSLDSAGVDVSPVCQQDLNSTTCYSLTSTIPGIKKFTYSSTVTLNATSTNWKFQFNGASSSGLNGSAGRSTAITNINQGMVTLISLNATLNNSNGNNSSPTFGSITNPYYCINQADIFTPGASDPDGDVLSYALTTALTPTGNVTYNTGYTAAQPLSTSAGSTLNTTNGQLSFTPNNLQVSDVVYQITETRSGVVVGTSMLEGNFVVLTCNNNPPNGIPSTISNGTITSTGANNTISACQKSATLTFHILPTDPQGDSITVSATGLPAGATFTIVGNGAPAPNATFTWNLTSAIPGTYVFYVNYKDNDCPLSSSQTIPYTITVLPLPTVAVTPITDTVCVGQTVLLTASGANTYSWAPAGTLSASTGTTVTATPAVGTPTYTVTGTATNGCTNTATAVVKANAIPAAPTSANVTYCQGATATALLPNGTGYKWYTVATGGTAVATITPSTATAGTTLYYVTQTTTNCESPRKTVAVTVNPTKTGTGTKALCQGTSYTWGGTTYSTAGVYTHIFTTSLGCDSTVTLTVTVNPTYNNAIAATICQGVTYPFAGTSYTATGVYPHTFTTVKGCDSIVTLTLTVNPTYNNTLTANICAGATYAFAGTTYAATGVYPHTFATVKSCDSIVTLHLTVNPVYDTTVNVTLCQGQTYTFAGNTYTTAGTHTNHFTSSHGCDSAVTIQITLNPTYSLSLNDTVCHGIMVPFAGTNYTTTGTYPHTFATVKGCDSVVTLNLYVKPIITHTYFDTICHGVSYTFGGTAYTTGGSYSHPFSTSGGCDSLVTLNLYVKPIITYTFADSICHGVSYTFGGTAYTASGAYSHTFSTAAGCDSTATVNLYVKPIITHTFADTTCHGVAYPFGGTSYTASGSYSHTFTTAVGCDSITTVNLYVKPVITHTFADTICHGVPYVFGGTSYTASGSYSHTFTTATGCDSAATVNLYVKPAITHSFNDSTCHGVAYIFGGASYTASGAYSHTFSTAIGCDSIATVNLYVKPAITYSFNDSICHGVPYQFGGSSYTASGAYSHTFSTAIGCDSIATVNLYVKPAITYAFNDSICHGVPYQFGGASYTASGAYSHTFSTAIGCDSIATVNLYVKPAITHSFPDTICHGIGYAFGGSSYTASGAYSHTFSTATGCDSIATLNLYVKPSITYAYTDTTCQGVPYVFGGTSYTASGSYSHTFSTATGCDSIVTLSLLVTQALTYSTTAGICQGATYAFGGANYTATGAYNHTFATAGGCDSIVTLHLTVNPVYTSTLPAGICQGGSYAFAGNTYTTTGNYPHTFTTVSGCDSTVTLQLTVHPGYTNTAAQNICQGGSYAFGGSTYTASGAYAHTFTSLYGCDSVVTLTLTVNPIYDTAVSAAICQGFSYAFGGTQYTTTGVYPHAFATVKGCDSTVTLHLTVNPLKYTEFYDSICSGTIFAFNGNVYDSTANYPLVYPSATGCDSTVTLHLYVKQTPAPPVVVSPDYMCQFSTPIALTATGQNLLWYTVATGGTGINTAPLPQTTNIETDNYYVSQTVAGCESARSLLTTSVVITPTAAVAASKDVYCQNDATVLIYSGTGTADMDYNWNTDGGQITAGTGQGPLTVSYNTTGIKTVSVQVDNHGCLSPIATTTLTVLPIPAASFTMHADACAGDTVVVALNHVNNTTSSYVWNFDGGATIFNPETGPYGIRWDVAGEHLVTMYTILNGCTSVPDSEFIYVHVKPSINLDAVSSTSVCAYDTISLHATSDSAISYSWQPAQFVAELTDSDAARIVVPTTGLVWVTATTAYGCTNTDSVGITTHLCCDLSMPSAFTPNGDGRNDVFRPITSGHQRVAWFRIVNRWGQIVFQTSDEHTAWDGTFNGVPQDMDTYYYTIKYQCADASQTFEKSGDVILIR